ncbi:hypothetical protein TRFO_09927 [Tritrichomonas foetus]|uniref:Condensation domain-containing protein n=1 Tax=Tritrichomonas foetus TaxID=1144522 RepID=A0A1J4JBH4_9EUKA|nr:hypothetical protein TRFO_09927 [Tritrichomonas foetus]|eukprot:OHS96534.1 hypothetical protein TRFO_09927 [Tritrichomonas foetus]
MFHSVKRPLQIYEKANYSSSRYMLQFGIEVENSNEIPRIIEICQKYVIPLRVRLEDKCYISANAKCSDPLQLPKLSSADSLLNEYCDWTYDHSYQDDVSLGTLAYNEKYIVLSLNHLCSDGGYFKWLLDLISTGERKSLYVPKLPIRPDFYCEREVKEMSKSNHPINPNELTYVKSRYLISEPKGEMKFICKKIDVNSYMNTHLNSSKKTISENLYKNFTEKMWSCYILAASAFNRKIDNFGIITLVDLRNIVKPSMVDWGNCNYFSGVTNKASTNMNQTMKKLGEDLRKSFDERMKSRDYLSLFNLNLAEDHSTGNPIELSNIGQLNLRNGINDATIQIRFPAKTEPKKLSMITYSINDTNGRNEIMMKMRYSPSHLHANEADILMESTKFAIEKITRDFTVQQAYEEIVSLQNSYSKKMYL